MKNLRVVGLASPHAFDVKWVNYDNLAVPTCSPASNAALHTKGTTNRSPQTSELFHNSLSKGIKLVPINDNDFLQYIFCEINIQGGPKLSLPIQDNIDILDLDACCEAVK